MPLILLTKKHYKKMNKKLLILLLIALTGLGNALRAQTTVTIANSDGVSIKYDIYTDQNYAKVGSNTNPASPVAVNIPSTVTYDGVEYPVTEIGYNAFDACNNITSVTIPSSVTMVKGYAFRNCTGLQTVNGASNVVTLESEAFKGCSALTSITLPSTLTTMGDYCFRDCSSLTSISIPASVATIPYYGFYGCASLTTVTFQTNESGTTSLQSIESYAFNNCTALNNISLPSSISYMNSGVFQGCTSLTSFTIPTSMTNIPYQTFDGCTSLQTVTFHDGITQINGEAFKGCSALTSITLPPALTSIGENAFASTGLTSVTMPSTVTGLSGFANCSNLASVTLNGGLISINDKCFQNCTALTSITIPSTVSRIYEKAFEGCTSLTSITIPENVTIIANSAFSGCTNLATLNWNATYCTKYPMPYDTYWPTSSTPRKDNYLPFYNCGLTTVTIGENVERLPDYFLAHNTSNGPAVTIPNNNSLTYIGKEALKYTTGLTTPNLSAVDTIEWQAFAYSSLQEITLPTTLTTLSTKAFEGCSSLTTIHYNAPNCTFKRNWYNNTNLGPESPFNLSSLQTITIGSTATTLPTNFMKNCTNAPAHVVFDTNTTLTTFPDDAFYYAGITAITIPPSFTSMPSKAFQYCSNLDTVYWNAVNCAYGEYSPFYNRCHPTTVVIGSTVQTLPTEFMYDNGSLSSVTFEENSQLSSIPNNAFLSCSGLTSITIPVSVSSIGSSAFQNTGLTSIIIPASVDSIEASAFYGCSSLTTVAIPAGITTIEESTFQSCSSLQTVSFAENSQLQSIGKQAFSGCTAIPSLSIPASVTSFGEEAFYNVNIILISDTQAAMPGCPWGAKYYNLYINGIFKYSDPDYTRLIGCTTPSATEITIPSQVVAIGDEAFAGMSNLTSVTFENASNITSLGNAIFVGCHNLGNVTINNTLLHASATDLSEYGTYTIPSTINAINAGAFYDCHDDNKNVIAFAVESGNTHFSVHDGVLYNADKSVLVAFPRGKDLSGYGYMFTVPNSVVALAPGAFIDYHYYKIVFSDNLETIGDYCFTGCNYGLEITIPERVSYIGTKAFNLIEGCLLSPTTPPTLGKNAFNPNNSYFYFYAHNVNNYLNNSTWQQYIHCNSSSEDNKKSNPAEDDNEGDFWTKEHTNHPTNSIAADKGHKALYSNRVSSKNNMTNNSCNYGIIFLDGMPYNFENTSDVPDAGYSYYVRDLSQEEISTASNEENEGKDVWNAFYVPFSVSIKNITPYFADDILVAAAPTITNNGVVTLKWSHPTGDYIPAGTFALFKTYHYPDLFPDVFYPVGTSDLTMEQTYTLTGATVTFHGHLTSQNIANLGNTYAYRNGELVEAGGSLSTIDPMRFTVEIVNTSSKANSLTINNMIIDKDEDGNDTVTNMNISVINVECVDGLKYEKTSENTVLMAGRCATDENSTTVTIPATIGGTDGAPTYNVTSIASFNNASNVTTISIPASVTSITPGAFATCTALTQFTVDANSTTFSANNGMLLSKNGNTLVAYPTGKTDASFSLPSNISTISSKAFAGNTHLTEIIPTATFAPNLGEEAIRSDIRISLPINLMGTYFMNTAWYALHPTVVVTDGQAYTSTYSSDRTFNAEYTRTFLAANSNYWQAVFVPFSAKYSETDWHKYGSLAKLAGVADLGSYYQLQWEYLQVDEVVEAGVPYIFKPNSTTTGNVTMEFGCSAVAKAAEAKTVSYKVEAANADDIDVTFNLQGTYEQKTGTGAANDVWYALTSGSFMQAGQNAVLNPYRIYFTITDDDNHTIQSPKGITNSLDGNEVGIEVINLEAPERPLDNNYYDVLGRRIEKPVPGRIYIHQGKKIIFER